MLKIAFVCFIEWREIDDCVGMSRPASPFVRDTFLSPCVGGGRALN